MDRFWKKTESDQNGCLLWTAGRFKDGYGGFYIKGSMHRAHRVSWEISCGVIPDGLQVLHSCDNPLCVNPEHLFLGSPDDNMKDMSKKFRGGRGQAKLTETDVAAIRSSREIAKELGRKYNVTESTICYVRRGDTWKGV